MAQRKYKLKYAHKLTAGDFVLDDMDRPDGSYYYGGARVNKVKVTPQQVSVWFDSTEVPTQWFASEVKLRVKIEG